MLGPVFFISATESLRPLQFLFLSMKMLPLVTARAAARGKFYVEKKKWIVPQNGKEEWRWRGLQSRKPDHENLQTSAKCMRATCSLLPVSRCFRWRQQELTEVQFWRNRPGVRTTLAQDSGHSSLHGHWEHRWAARSQGTWSAHRSPFTL